MTEIRPVRSLRPSTLAHNYRLNIKSTCTPKTIVGRGRPEEPLPDDDVVDCDIKSQLSINVNMDRDFEAEEEAFYFDLNSPTGVWGSAEDPVIQIYEYTCKKLGSVVSSSVKSNLIKPVFSQKFSQLQTSDCKAICCALIDNRYVQRIEFEQNGLSKASVDHLGQVIGASSFLTHVTIVDNELKSYGAEVICEAVSASKMIQCLDLSGNGFVESDGTILKTMLDKTDVLVELYLARNSLMDFGVKEIASAVETSISLKVLDLQWNHIRLGGAVAIGQAIEQNRSLETINLAWNGLHMEGAEAIADALKENETLKELDLTCNRLSEKCVAQILMGLDSNKTLEVIRLAQNHITCTGAEAILRHLANNKTSGIKVLDFGNQEVKDTFVSLYKELQQQRPFHVMHGIVWDTSRKSLTTAGEDNEESALLSCNPLTVLMECMRLQNFRLIDLFKSLDVNRSNFICINELCDGLMKVGVPVRRAMLLKLLNRLDKDGNNMIDYGEMIEAQNLHRKNLRKALQQSDSDFDKTETGKVSALLRLVMAKHTIMKREEHDTRIKTPKKEVSRTPSPYPLEQVETRVDLEGSDSGASKTGSTKTGKSKTRAKSGEKQANKTRNK